MVVFGTPEKPSGEQTVLPKDMAFSRTGIIATGLQCNPQLGQCLEYPEP